MPKMQKIQFPNAAGELLAASLTLPDRPPRAHALFAHCFTCGKDVAVAARIARSLAAHGLAVLRFDFTGLGGSEGDFGNSSFSSNVEDLVAAADYLRREHRAPELLIGHSLGGTAVLSVAGQIPESQAVVTIGAPASPEHVAHLFVGSRSEMARDGEATVSIAGREFRIKQAFLDDLEHHPLAEQVANLRRALLVCHAPWDDVVGVDEAARIFTAAKHPKSFVSLDGADHLLSRPADVQYVADTIAIWAARYLSEQADPRARVAGGEVLVAELNQRFTRAVTSDTHTWLADEPRPNGDDLGPDPYEHLLAALGTCTSMTIRMYANRKKWSLANVDVRLTHARRHLEDCENCDDADRKLESVHRVITLEGDLSAEQRSRLIEIADRCPVHLTLKGRLQITTRDADAAG